MSMDNSFFVNQASSSSNLAQQSQQTTSLSYIDDLIKEYLIFRGFNSSLKSFDHDLKQDKDKSFKSDKITDLLLSFVYQYDLNGLIEYWTYLDLKYFSRLTLKFGNYTPSSLSRKFEIFLLRYYLVYTIQNNKQDKAFELFENYSFKLQSQVEWKDWYCLPFLKNPEENSLFSIYFSKNWIDTFLVSLQNFLNIVFQSLQLPKLVNYDEEFFWSKQVKPVTAFKETYYTFEQDYLQNELTDEFQLLDQNTQNRQTNTFIDMLKNLTKPKSNKVAKPVQAKPDQVKTEMSTVSNLVNRKITLPSLNDIKQNEKEEKEVKIESIDSYELDVDLEPEPYLTLSQEDYGEHKAEIINCKFSPDGKYVSSLDCDGVIKIWCIENSLSTISTLVIKGSSILEWNKNSSSQLLIGTRLGLVKTYDLISKKAQDFMLNNLNTFCMNQIFSSPTNHILFILSFNSQNKSSFLTKLDINNGTNLSFNFNNFYCLSACLLKSNILLGCSDGSIRVYDCEKQKLNQIYKLEKAVLGLKPNKVETELFTIENDCIKIFQIDQDLNLNLKKESNVKSDSLNELHVDSNENYGFYLSQNGASLIDLLSFKPFSFKFDMDGATCLDQWSSSHLCLLLIGSSNGLVRVFKLLHQF